MAGIRGSRRWAVSDDQAPGRGAQSGFGCRALQWPQLPRARHVLCREEGPQSRGLPDLVREPRLPGSGFRVAVGGPAAGRRLPPPERTALGLESARGGRDMGGLDSSSFLLGVSETPLTVWGGQRPLLNPFSHLSQ